MGVVQYVYATIVGISEDILLKTVDHLNHRVDILIKGQNFEQILRQVTIQLFFTMNGIQ